MKKLLSVLVAIVMCACLCLPAFAAEDVLAGLTGSLGDLDLGEFDMDSITAGLGDLTAGLGSSDGADPLAGIMSSIEGLLGGSSEGGAAEFDPTGVLSSFVEGLNFDQITELFAGFSDSLSSLGISLPSGGEGSEGGFDISSILGGNSGDGAGVAAIMDVFGGVLESLGLDSAIIESLGQSDIVNFFAKLYMGSVPTPEEPTETTTAPTTQVTTTIKTGVNDGAAVMAACATISVAAAALFVCTRKKHA